MIEGKLKHSGLGIFSFVIGVVVGILEFVILIVAGVVEITRGLQSDTFSLSVIVICLFTGAGLSCFGLGLSVGAFFQKERLRIFPFLGFFLNLLIVVIMAGLFFITTFFAR
jgi:hypothetical protein